MHVSGGRMDPIFDVNHQLSDVARCIPADEAALATTSIDPRRSTRTASTVAAIAPMSENGRSVGVAWVWLRRRQTGHVAVDLLTSTFERGTAYPARSVSVNGRFLRRRTICGRLRPCSAAFAVPTPGRSRSWFESRFTRALEMSEIW